MNDLSFTKQPFLSGAEKAAILFGELSYATSGVMEYLSTDEIKKIRKNLKYKNKFPINDYATILPNEIKVLEDFVRRGKECGLTDANPVLFDSAAYANLHGNDENKQFLKNLSKNADAVANVLKVWLKEDK